MNEVMQAKFDQIQGKGVYIWMLDNIFNGDLNQIIAELKRAKIRWVAIKLHNGYDPWDEEKWQLDPFIQLCADNGIGVVGWGYDYIKYDPVREAQVALTMCGKYQHVLLAYLIDAEKESENQDARARLFMNTLLPGLEALGIPAALNSSRFPSLHPDKPWEILRNGTQFDCPQMYWRNGDPLVHLELSRAEFAAMIPRLPYLPAGDLYYEHGIKPIPVDVVRFLDACQSDPEIQAALMWAMDQIETTPELWQTFTSYAWPVGDEQENPLLLDARMALNQYIVTLRQRFEAEPTEWQEILDDLCAGAGQEIPDVPPVELGLYMAMQHAVDVANDTGNQPTPSEYSLYAAAVRAFSGLNVRSGPGTEYEKVRDPLANGSRIEIYEELPDRRGDLWGRISKIDAEVQQYVHLGWVVKL